MIDWRGRWRPGLGAMLQGIGARRSPYVTWWEWHVEPRLTVAHWLLTGRCLTCGIKLPGHKLQCAERPSGGPLIAYVKPCPECERAVLCEPGGTISGCADHGD